MFSTKLNIIQYVLTILDIEKKLHKLLIFQGIYYAINIINTKHDTYPSVNNMSHSKMFILEIYQIFIFRQRAPNILIIARTQIKYMQESD